MNLRHIIRIQCSDRKGLIAAITGVVFANNLNIVVMKEFVETNHNLFFARLEVSGEMDPGVMTTQLREQLPGDAIVEIIAQEPKQLVILVTKEYHCLCDLLVRHHFGEMNAKIKAVIGNYDALQNITERFDLPFICISHEEKEKQAYEQEVLALLQQLNPDYIVLAKFMRILSPGFVAAFSNRIINIHHSFLPAFVGANPYRKAYERGVKLIGATAHFVTNDLDEGPIITQKVIAADHEYDVAGMVKAGHEVEKSVLADALKLVLEDRVFVTGNRTIIFD
jgi:formyltetrahydrofolate deformylase